MKFYTFKISEFSKDFFFPKERIKTKFQIINILLEASRYMLSNIEVSQDQIVGEIRIVVDKMNRIFFSSENKCYSIVFPFNVLVEEDNIRLSFSNNINVDSYIISKAKSAINCDEFNDTCILGFADSIYDNSNDLDNEELLWSFIKELMLFEVGYIRYDYDELGYEEAVQKGCPHRHPLNHYDLFYTNRATCKIGLTEKQTMDSLIDLLNVGTDCKYLRN